MSRFTDGPAAGVTLSLRRSPMMLRVVQDRAGKFDALDQPNDAPAPGETITVYVSIPGTFTSGFVDGRDKQGRRTGSQFQSASYRMLPSQPEDRYVRTAAAWAAWCDANREALVREHHAGAPRSRADAADERIRAKFDPAHTEPLPYAAKP